MIAPHGGRLVNRTLEGNVREEWLARIGGWHKLEIDYERVVDVENIAMGIYSPIEGFMCRKEYEAVLKEGRLTDDTVYRLYSMWIRMIYVGIGWCYAIRDEWWG